MLERRTKLARQHIEELAHGRERCGTRVGDREPRAERGAGDGDARAVTPSAADAADFPVLTDVVELPELAPEAAQDLPPLPEIKVPGDAPLLPEQFSRWFASRGWTPGKHQA